MLKGSKKKILKQNQEENTEMNVLSLRPKVWKIEINKEKIKDYLSFNKKPISIVGVIIVSLIVSSSWFRTTASIANFYSTSCLGGWENVELAEGEPNADPKDQDSFAKSNSAVLDNSSAELLCGKFLGKIPEAGTPTKFAVRFSLLVTDQDKVKSSPVIDSLPSESLDEIRVTDDNLIIDGGSIDDFGTGSDDIEVSNETPVENTEGASEVEVIEIPTETESGTSTEVVVPVEANETPVEVAPVPSADSSENTVSLFRRIFSNGRAQAQEESAPTESPAEEAPTETPAEQPAEAPSEISETPVEQPTEQPAEEPSVIEEAVTPSDQAVEEVIDVVEIKEENISEVKIEEENISSDAVGESTEGQVVETNYAGESSAGEVHSNTDYLEVFYTIDGTDWKSIGVIHENNWQDASFDLPSEYFTEWEDLTNLQIKLQSIDSFDRRPVILLDSVWVEVSYDEDVVNAPKILIENPEGVILGEQYFTPSQGPEFIITKTEFSDAELLDMVAKKKAKILEDKDGYFSKKAENAIAQNELGENHDEIIEDIIEEESVLEKVADVFLNIFDGKKDEEKEKNKEDENKENLDGIIYKTEEEISDQETEVVEVIQVLDGENINDILIEETEEVIEVLESTEEIKEEVSIEPEIAPTIEPEVLPEDTLESTEEIPSEETPLTETPLSFLRNIFKNKKALAQAENTPAVVPSNVKVSILDPVGNVKNIAVQVEEIFEGTEKKYRIKLDKPGRDFMIGKYKLVVEMKNSNNTILLQQDFAWGVLAINTNKSIYKPGDTANIFYGVLNETGSTLCDADLFMTLTLPNNDKEIFSTDNGRIVKSGDCFGNNVTSLPDYSSIFEIPNILGEVEMELTANTFNGPKTITDSFEIQDYSPAEITRTGPTRVYPMATYPITLTVKANEDFKGELYEYAPARFEISPLYGDENIETYSNIKINGNEKIIKWDLELEAGETVKLGYIFDAPNKSPELYLLGEAQMRDNYDKLFFEEIRPWQIANDVPTVTILTSGTSWTVPADWDDNSNTIEVIGGGGGGGNVTTGGGGGGGGAYAAVSNLDLTPGSVTIGIGAGGATETAGGNTWFNAANYAACVSTTVCVSAEGGSGSTTGATGGAGGTTGGIGTTEYAGGTGGDGTGNGADSSGGGGGAGGPGGAGKNGGAGDTNTAGAEASGGGGGAGGGSSTAGTAGTTDGGAGGNGPDGDGSGAGGVGGGGTSGTNGGGGGGADGDAGATGGDGGDGAEWTTAGAGGGGGGSDGTTGATGGLYGGGGGGTDGGTAGSGAQGVIVITYTPLVTMDVSGTVYANDKTTALTGRTVHLRVNGTLAGTGGTGTGIEDSDGSGNFSFTGVSATSGDTITLYLDGETEIANTVTITDGSTSITGIPLYDDHLVLRSDNSTTAITNADLADYDHDDDNTDLEFSANGGTLVVEDGTKLFIVSGETFTPGGAVTTDVSNDGTDSILDGDIEIDGTGIMTMGTNALSVGGDFLNEGTFNKSTGQTTTFTATATGHTITDGGENFDSITFNGASGGWSFADSTTVDVDMTITNGTLSGSSALIITGDLSLASGGTMSGTANVTVNGGGVTGDGTITLTSSSTFTVNTAGNFGGATAWTFYNLTIGAAGNATTTSTGAGGVTVSNVLTIDTGDTLDAKGKTWTLSGTSGTPMVISGTFNDSTDTSTFLFNGINGGGDTTIPTSIQWHNLQFDNASEVYTVGATTTLSGTLTITNGTFSITGTTNFTMAYLNVAATGIFTSATSAQIFLTGTSGTIWTNAGTFNEGTSVVFFSSDADVTLLSAPEIFNVLLFAPTMTSSRAYNTGAAITTTSTSATSSLWIAPAGSGLVLTVTLGGDVNVGNGSATAGLVIGPTSGTATTSLDTNNSGNYAITTGVIDLKSGCSFLARDSVITFLRASLGTVFTNTGTFTAGTSSVVYSASSPSATVTLTSGAITFYDLTLSPTLGASRVMTLTSGLAVTNDFTISPESAGAFALAVTLVADLVVTGDFSMAPTSTGAGTTRVSFNTSAVSNYAFTAATISINSASANTFSANDSVITLTGTTGTLFTASASGHFAHGTSTVIVQNASGSPTLLSAAETFNDLTINSSGTVVNAGAIITLTTSGTLALSAGVLDDGGFQITGTGTNALTMTSGTTLQLGAAGTATLYPTNFTSNTLDAASTVVYQAGVAQTVSSTPTYGNLTITTNSTKSLNGTTAVAGTTTIQTSGTLDTTTANDYTLSTAYLNVATTGTLIANDSTINLTGTSGILFTLVGTFDISTGTSIVDMTGDGTATINSGSITYDTLTSSGTGTKSASTNLSVNNNLNVSDGTFSMGTRLMTGSGTNILTVSNGATLNVGNSTFAGNYTSFETITLNTGSTVDYNLAGTQTVDETLSYSNLTISTSGTKSLNGTTTATGTTTISGGTLDTTGSGYTFNTAYLDIGASGTLLANGSIISLTGTSGTLFTRTGTFTQGTSKVYLTGNGNATINSGTITFYRLLSSGTGTKTAASAFTINENLTIAAGTFDPGTFLMTGSGTNVLSVSNGATLDVDAGTFAGNYTSFETITLSTGSTVDYNRGGVQTIDSTLTYSNLKASTSGAKSLDGTTTATGTTTITGATIDTTGTNFTLNTAYLDVATGGTLDINGATLNLTATSGTLFTLVGTFDVSGGASTVNLTGNGNATINSGTITFDTLTSSGTGTKSAATALTINNDLNVSAGTFDPAAFLMTGSGTNVLTVSNGATLDVDASTFGGNYTSFETITLSTGSTVSYTRTSDQTIASDADLGTNYSNLYIGENGTKSLNGTTTVIATTTIRQNSPTLTFTTTSASNYTFNTGYIDLQTGEIDLNASAVNITGTSGTLFSYSGGTFTYDTSTIDLTGDGSATINNAAITFYRLVSSGTGTKSLSGIMTIENSFEVSDGVFDPANTSYYVLGAGATLTVSSTGNIYVRDTNFTDDYNSFASHTFSGTSTVEYMASGDQGVISGGTLGADYVNLIFSGSGTKIASEDITATADITINGTATFDTASVAISMGDDLVISASTALTANASTIRVDGDFTNSGTFTYDTSTVQFPSDNNSTIVGDTTFYSLDISSTVAKTMSFTAGDLFTINGTFTVTGNSGQLIKLWSTASPTQWIINHQGTETVSYADVKDSDCDATSTDITTTNSNGSGQNNDTCWVFGDPTLTFSLGANSVNLGTLTSATTGTGSHTFSAATNATGGFAVYVNGATLTTALSDTISAIGGTPAVSDDGTEQFGINVVANGTPAVGANVTTNSGTCGYGTGFGTANQFKFVAGSDNTLTAVTAAADCVYTASYIGNITPITDAGAYSTTLTYTIVGTF